MNIVIPLILLVIDLITFQFTNFDLAVQDLFYNFQNSTWLLSNKNNWFLHFILYSGEKKLVLIFGISVVLALIFFRKNKIVSDYKSGLMIVAFSLIVVPFTVGQLKGNTNMPCPCQLDRYGGKFPEIKLFNSYPSNFIQTQKAKCYPAGHASGGFALMGLYFLFKTKRNKRLALTSAFLTGWITGLYKMMNGDHFLSHTITTMLLAWILIFLVSKIVYNVTQDKEEYEAG
ncbi:MAG: phosphatase PAP2 family protein [Sulfurovaceae bacterium]|nr:phosphatase PAP2 family protein [Sulfurovaceae bacterium]